MLIPGFRQISSLLRAAVLAGFASLAVVAPARADLLSFLAHLGEEVAPLGEEVAPLGETGAAVRWTAQHARGLPRGAKRATVKAAASGTFHIVAEDGSLLAAFRPEDGPAVLGALTDHHIALPESLLVKRTDVAQFLLAQPLPLSVLADDGELWPLRLARAGPKDSILVSASPTLSLTVEAFARRRVLEHLSAAPLVRRMQVIPLISNDDQVVAFAFRDTVTRASAPPVSREAALDLIGRTHENLLVVTGHIEGDAFVVRDLTGEEQFRITVADIYRAAKEARSEVLLLGCRVACATPHSGPLHDITADAVVRALAGVDVNGNALTFLEQLSDKVGPLLVQDDHSGGFLVIDDADTRRNDRKWAAAGTSVRLTLRTDVQDKNALIVPTGDPNPILLLFVTVAACVAILAMGWPMLILGGIGPKRAWRLIKELRARCLKLEDAIAPIPDDVVLLYIVFGPSIFFIQVFEIIALGAMAVVIFIACAPGGILIVFLALIGALRFHKRCNSLPSESRPGPVALLSVMGLPLLIAAGLAGTISPILLGDLSFDTANLIGRAVPAGIGIFPVCVTYGIALWSRFPRLLVVCGRTTHYLFEWPGLLLAWAEVRIMRVRQPRAA